MADSGRARRLGERIHEIVARMLETRIKDPRLGFVTVTDVRVTGDLQHATVFYTVYGSDEDRASSAAALKSATGIIRSEVGKQTGVRLTPSLEFVLDALPTTAKDMADRLAEAKQRDERIAAQSAGATFAGEADPYKKPRELEDEGVEGDSEDLAAADDEAGADAEATSDVDATSDVVTDD